MQQKGDKKKIVSAAVAFVILMAFVSLFSDMTHEGANSMIGAFEDYLGAPSIVIAAVGGAATLIGCSLRMLTGYIADKTKKYWSITIIGYAIDLIAIPLLSLVPDDHTYGFILAVTFVLLEKVGKAIKKPAKDTIVSFAAKENGVGKSFAFSEALDQIGACLGPMILTATYLIFSNLSEYQKFIYGFLALGIPAVICMVLLLIARNKFKHPENFETEEETANKPNLLKNKAFILFIIASCFLAIGYLDSFSLISKDLFTKQVLGEGNNSLIPLLYSYAMFIDAISAVVFGILFDKKGFISVVIAVALTASYSFFIFNINGLVPLFIGLTMWGIGIGALESIMKSAITTFSGKKDRAKAFGTYEFFFGIFAFAGSFLIGWLYDVNKLALCIVSTSMIVLATAFFICCDLYFKKENTDKINKVINQGDKQ